MKEISQLRTLTTKTHDLWGNKSLLEVQQEPVHYFNKLWLWDGQKRIREVDFTLKENEKGWYFEYNNFIPLIPRYSNEWVEFRDVFSGKDQKIRYKAECNKTSAIILPKLEGITESTCIMYPNAFGKHKDYVIYFTRTWLAKVVRIREWYKTEEDLRFKFEVDFAGKSVFRTDWQNEYKLTKSQSKTFDSTKFTKIGNDEHTIIRPFKAWNDKWAQSINVDYSYENGKYYITKIVPKEMFNGSAVYTDAISTINANTWFGEARKTAANWALTHDATTADSIVTDDGSDRLSVLVWQASWNYVIYRNFFSFDTSWVAADDTIDSVTLALHPDYVQDDDNDGRWYISITEASQASTTAIVVADYDNVTTTELIDTSERKDLTSITTGGYVYFKFNSAWNVYLNRSGDTKLCVREWHDIEDDTYAGGNNTQNQFRYFSPDVTTITQAPRLFVQIASPENDWTLRSKPWNTYNDTIIYESDIEYQWSGTQFYTRAKPTFQDNALYFNGNNTALANTTNQDLNFTNAWSIEFWINTSSNNPTGTDTIFDIANWSDNTNRITLDTWSSSYTGTTFSVYDSWATLFKQYSFDLTTDTKYHLMFTWDGTDLTIYSNWTALSPTKTTDNAGTMTNTNRQVKVGSKIGVSQYAQFVSPLMSLWNTTLNSDNVTSIYAGGIGYKKDHRKSFDNYSSQVSLAHYWNMGRDSTDIGADLWNGSTTMNIWTNAENMNADDITIFDFPS